MTTGNNERSLTEKILRNIPVFKSLSDAYIRQMAMDVKIVGCRKGGTVFHQSDETSDLFIVLNGEVKASLFAEDGNELILAVFRQGDFFGEMSLLDGFARSATITAAEDTTLGVLRREAFLHTMKQNPNIAIDLLATVVGRLRETNAKMEALAFFGVDERLVRYLIQIASEQGERDSKGFYKIKKITHKDLGSRIGASRESVSKALKILAINKRVVEHDGYFIVRPDAPGKP